MTKIYYHSDQSLAVLDPDKSGYEVVERKFRGHPDSLADMVAQSFMQKYIYETWNLFPELSKKYFPNFSADKVTLSGSSIRYKNGKYDVLKPVDALLIGKITKQIGGMDIDIDTIFKRAIEDVFSKSLGHDDYKEHVRRMTYSVTLAGVDHHSAFYNPGSISDLIEIVRSETHANDTVFVVAFAPYSVAEKLCIYLDNLTDSKEFKDLFPEIGSDIKAMVRRRGKDFDLTLCLPVFPERITNIGQYEKIINEAKTYLFDATEVYLNKTDEYAGASIELRINTKDTLDKKYLAVWGTALSKGDIGAVGRGNRQQGFISGLRPSTNEAISGKNPNHFAGIICYLLAENISQQIYLNLGLKNAVYIVANNGDKLSEPNSIDVVLEGNFTDSTQKIENIIRSSLQDIDLLRSRFIDQDPFERFMNRVDHGV